MVSIIVPVYNVEKYLEQCLESLRNQSLHDIEVILVDDGSSDSSGSICDRYAAADSRFVVIHKPNGGLSSARNAGLAVARGEYIGFMDSDDWAEPRMYERLLELITTHRADIAQIGLRKAYRGISFNKPYGGHEQVLTRDQAMAEMLTDRIFPNYTPIKLYRREVINIGFPEGRTYEDVFVQVEYFNRASRIAIAPDILYNYRMRRSAITHTVTVDNIRNFIEAIDYRIKLLNKYCPELFTPGICLSTYAYRIVDCAKNYSRSRADAVSRLAMVTELSERLSRLGSVDTSAWRERNRKRYQLLLDDPKAFMLKARRSGRIDLFSRFLDWRMY